MAQRTAREASEEVAAAHRRRDILRAASFGTEEDFAARAGVLRQRLRSSVDSSETIRADRDRDGMA